MKSHWMEHNGRQVFYADYSGFGSNAEALYQEAEEAIGFLSQQPSKSTLVLADFAGTAASVVSSDVFRKLLPKSNQAVIKRAVIGLSAAGRIFMNTLSNVTGGMPVRAFDSEQAALNWLMVAHEDAHMQPQEAVVPPRDAGKKSRWVEHNGRRILIADFSNYVTDAASMRAECDLVREILHAEPPNSVRSLTSVEGTFGNAEIMQILASLLPETNKYVCKRAVVGVSGYRRHLLEKLEKMVGKVQFSVFDTVEQALDWLAKD